MGLLSANMLALLRRPGAEVYKCVDIAWNSGSTGRYSTHDWQVPGYRYEGRIASAGLSTIGSQIGQQPGETATQAWTVTLADPQRTIEALLEGATDQRRSAVTFKLASPLLSADDWATRAVAILDGWTYDRGIVKLKVSTDNRVLQGDVPKTQIQSGHFPGAPVDSLGVYLPIVYGYHDAVNLSATGQVPAVAYSIDGVYGYRYCVTIGQAKAVPRVYKNGTLQTLTTHYTITRPVVSGIQMTSIDFVSATVASDSITCDVDGLTDDGTSSGEVITNPVDQLEHWLANFVFNEYRSGTLYDPDNIPRDSASFDVARAVMAGINAEASRRLGGSSSQSKASEELRTWARSWPILRTRWNESGKLALVPFLMTSTAAYPTLAFSQALGHDLEPLSLDVQSDYITRQVDLSYLYGSAASTFWQKLTCQDPDVPENVTEGIELYHSTAQF